MAMRCNERTGLAPEAIGYYQRNGTVRRCNDRYKPWRYIRQWVTGTGIPVTPASQCSDICWRLPELLEAMITVLP
jgi:hypothetical protein